MKKIVIAATVLAVCVAIAVFCAPSQTNADFLRIHIRADSNNIDDQNVKYAVKVAVVDYLTPKLIYANTKQKAMQVVEDCLPQIKAVCDQALRQNGFNYTATVQLCREQFPDRTYNGTTLSAGVYDALIINLGSGSGNNWWCVVYPPLCFVGSEGSGSGIVYKSLLMDIINSWRNG